MTAPVTLADILGLGPPTRPDYEIGDAAHIAYSKALRDHNSAYSTAIFFEKPDRLEWAENCDQNYAVELTADDLDKVIAYFRAQRDRITP